MIKRYKEFINENYLGDITQEEKELLKKYDITKYNKFNPETNLIDVFQDVHSFISKGFTELPNIRFGNIYGNFKCCHNKLTSLKNCPQIIDGDFYCNDNLLTSLEFCPNEVLEGGVFFCNDNLLTSLQYCPKEIYSNFYCFNNKLTSLEYCPEIVHGTFDCSKNKLTSLEYGPKQVERFYYCNDNNLSSIEDYPLCIIKNVDLTRPVFGGVNNLLTNKYFKKILKIVTENEEIFSQLLDDKIKFHQMVMRLNPDLIQYYKTITPPKNKSTILI